MKQNSKPIMRIYNGDKKLDDAAMNRLFMKQLDNIYCIKKHLITVLPQLAGQASFPDLQAAILENADLLKLQLLRMDVIYKLLNSKYEDHNCLGIKILSLEAYIAAGITDQPSLERDLALLVNLQIIESVETAYFEALKKIAGNFINKEVELLLDQNLEASVNNKLLYELISKEYIS